MKHLILVLGLAGFLVGIARADGIPEPGYIFYGEVRDPSPVSPEPNGLTTLTWDVSTKPTGRTVRVRAPLVSKGGGVYTYRVRIPYESVLGGNSLGQNALSLTSATTGYDRQTVWLSSSTRVWTASFEGAVALDYSFNAATRGLVQSINLNANTLVSGVGGVVPTPSPSVAGGPPSPVLSLWFTRVHAYPSGGTIMEWSGTLTNRTYQLLRSQEVAGSTSVYETVATFPSLGGGTVVYWDGGTGTNQHYFYQLKAD